MTIEQYLTGKVDFNLNESTLAAILFDRGVIEGASVTTVTERQRDLCLADLYMFVANSSTSSSSEMESDGGWVRQKANKNVANRNTFVSLAKALYEKWGVAVPASGTKVTLKPLY